MRESDSSQSSDATANSHSHTDDSAHVPLTQPEKEIENTHGYFVPLVLTIVLGVIVTTTFYSNEFNNLVVDLLPFNRNDEHLSDASEHISTVTERSLKPEATTEASVIEESINAEQSLMETANTTAATESNESGITTADRVAPLQPAIIVADDNTVSYRDRYVQYPGPHTYPQQGMEPERDRHAYQEKMTERRRAYEQARQARKQHIMIMNQYRAAVRQRIEQDRKDMSRRSPGIR